MERTELELWQVVDDYFDTFFLTERITCLCDLVVYMGFSKIGLLTFAERDLLLNRIRKYARQKKVGDFSPIWAFGEIEPRKEFIQNIKKHLNNGGS